MMKPAQVVKALAQPTCLAIYRLLVARGPEGMAAALATVVGVLIEVPVMLLVVKIVNVTKVWYEQKAK